MLQANPCWQGALEASLERGRLCVREHLIEKEVCHVQIPEAIYAQAAQPGHHRTRGLSRLCCCRGGATKRSTQGVEALSPYLTYLMLLAGALIIGVITGPLIERLFLRRVYGQAEAIQLLLTFSILLILDDLIKLIWGATPLMVSMPPTLLGHVSLAGIPYTWYHFLLIGVSIVFGGTLVCWCGVPASAKLSCR
jgi:hypothetical protein